MTFAPVRYYILQSVTFHIDDIFIFYKNETEEEIGEWLYI